MFIVFNKRACFPQVATLNVSQQDKKLLGLPVFLVQLSDPATGEENTGKNTEEIITFKFFWWEIPAYDINISASSLNLSIYNDLSYGDWPCPSPSAKRI